MKDIDFDELDRAVNTAMSNVPADEDRSSLEPALVIPQRGEPMTTASSATGASSSPAVRRSGGRFMDVVHPSSDMRSASTPRVAPVVNTDTPVPTPPPQPLVTDVAPVASSTSSTDFQWPDPLDVTPTPADAPVPDDFTLAESKVPLIEDGADDDLPEGTPLASFQPLESPFIDGAKVEKRPLGAFSVTSADEADPAPAPLDLTAALEEDAEVAAEPVQPVEPAQQADDAPSKEAPDPLKIETLEVSEETLIGSSESDETSQPQVSASKEESAQVPVAAPLVSETTAPIAAASIPQQYKEHPVSDDQPSGAIYDTETYHQPLTHPQKKSSSWPIILWIIGLMMLGAGIGFLLYFFVLPQL